MLTIDDTKTPKLLLTDDTPPAAGCARRATPIDQIDEDGRLRCASAATISSPAPSGAGQRFFLLFLLPALRAGFVFAHKISLPLCGSPLKEFRRSKNRTESNSTLAAKYLFRGNTIYTLNLVAKTGS